MRVVAQFAVRAMACLLVAACMGETQERPPVVRNASGAAGAASRRETPRPEPPPFPTSAFQAPPHEARGPIDADRSGARRAAAAAATDHTTGDHTTGGRAPARSAGATRAPGRPIDLDVKGADLHDVLRLVADVGGVGIVVAGEVRGTVTLTLKQVPWERALDVITQTKGLVAAREGSVIVVRPP